MVKKTTLAVLAFCCMTAAQAKILRVNNVSGMAPYASIQDAVDAAQDGDTIMVDGSPQAYEKTTLYKRVVLVGPGYFLQENGIATATVNDATVIGLTIQSEGSTIIGIHIHDGNLVIQGAHTVITRCRTSGWTETQFVEGADNCILHQNYFGRDGLGGGFQNPTYNHQITNNIMKMDISSIYNSYIAYNTGLYEGGTPNKFYNSGNTIERNIINCKDFGEEDERNTYKDNYYYKEKYWYENDKEVKVQTERLSGDIIRTYGAFAGTDPYVLSGIPAGPVIEELTVPASVEEGSKLNVTIKLGLQK